MTASITERIEAGVAYLDVHAPGWVERIDPARLDIRHAECCILGQLLGSYYEAPISLDAAIACGFDAEAEEDPMAAAEFAALQEAWLAWFEREAARREAACCPCRGLLCDPGCPCPSCPKTDADLEG